MAGSLRFLFAVLLLVVGFTTAKPDVDGNGAIAGDVSNFWIYLLFYFFKFQ